MSQIIKAFTGVFMVMFLMATGVGLLGAFLQTLQAQNLHGKVIDELENSDYAISVLKEVFEIAEEQGVVLEILLYLENGTVMTCESQMMVPDSLEDVKLAEVSLVYPVRIPFVGLDKSHRIIGYAR